MTNELPFEKLRKECDPKRICYETTEKFSPLEEIIGQKRVIKALGLGLEIEQCGCNIYAAGSTSYRLVVCPEPLQ